MCVFLFIFLNNFKIQEKVAGNSSRQEPIDSYSIILYNSFYNFRHKHDYITSNEKESEYLDDSLQEQHPVSPLFSQSKAIHQFKV